MDFCIIAPSSGCTKEKELLCYKEGQTVKVLQINDLIT